MIIGYLDPWGKRYNPDEFKGVKVSSEIEELFNCITRPGFRGCLGLIGLGVL